MTTPQAKSHYLDMQAEVGITKHNGGIEATNELIALCHLQANQEVLYVGCGIGAGPSYLTKTCGCHVVGVDISEKMVEWSRQRAKEDGIESKVELRVADVLDLPFEDNRFDAVLVESVIAFVPDKPRAIGECVRVTKPGGYVGLNETFWFTKPAPEIIALVREEIGAEILQLEEWQQLWAGSQLQDRVEHDHQINARAEIKSRLQWVGWRWVLRAFGRLFYLYLMNRLMRASVSKLFGSTMDSLHVMGYGIFVGRK